MSDSVAHWESLRSLGRLMVKVRFELLHALSAFSRRGWPTPLTRHVLAPYRRLTHEHCCQYTKQRSWGCSEKKIAICSWGVWSGLMLSGYQFIWLYYCKLVNFMFKGTVPPKKKCLISPCGRGGYSLALLDDSDQFWSLYTTYFLRNWDFIFTKAHC